MQWARKWGIPLSLILSQGSSRRWFTANGFVRSPSANAAAFSSASSLPPPQVGLQRVDENLDVRVLHVRVLAGSIFVVWVPGSIAPSLFELLLDMS